MRTAFKTRVRLYSAGWSVHRAQQNTCERSICEIDKHLAYEIAELTIGYNPYYKTQSGKTVTPTDEGYANTMFDRVDRCEHRDMVPVNRDDHNNDQHVRVASPVQNVQTFSAPAELLADHAADDDFGSFGTVVDVNPNSPAEIPNMSRGSASADEDFPYAITEDGQDWETPEVYAKTDDSDEEPAWSFIEMSQRGQWAANGWDVNFDVEYVPPPTRRQDPMDFGTISFAPYNPAFDSPVVAPAFTHDTAPVATDEEFDNANEVVTQATPSGDHLPDDNELYADAVVAEDEPAPAETNSPANGSNDAPSSKGYSPNEASLSSGQAEAAPAPVVKAAATFNHQKCCGEYPRRYKYSANKQGCCIENVGPYANPWGYLYSPARGKCCIKTVSAQGPRAGTVTYTRYANNQESCDDLLEPHTRR